ncbi:MAG: DNA-binding protein [Deltaproteobacteria bacterium]|nr:DNA-binding protein [Deltaproteobacteria bacterium]
MAQRDLGDDKRGRSLTIPATRLTRAEVAEGIALAEWMDYRRPAVRAECVNGPRPCPYVSCKHHLYLDVNPVTGSIKINFPDIDVTEMEESCALDVAERGGQTLEEVGAIMNLTRERIRQVEVSGLERLQAEDFALDLEDAFTS